MVVCAVRQGRRLRDNEDAFYLHRSGEVDLVLRNLNTNTGADIEQPLTRRNLIKPTDLFPKQAKDFDLYLVQPFNEVVQLALHGHADAMNPFE